VDILNNKGLESVADDLKWVMQKGDLPKDQDEMKDEIADMLSVFEPQEALPGEFKTPESPLTSERSRKYQEFSKLSQTMRSETLESFYRYATSSILASSAECSSRKSKAAYPVPSMLLTSTLLMVQ
jgi:hypothetical protein